MKTALMTTKELKNSFMCPYCNKPAFYVLKPLKIRESLKADNVKFDDGSHPTPGDLIICQYCKHPICGRFV